MKSRRQPKNSVTRTSSRHTSEESHAQRRVKLAKTRDEAILAAEDILPMTIHKHKVNGVLVAEGKNILHEYYVSISVDRSSRDYDVLATANGGTEVEEIAKEHPESVKRLHIQALDDFDIEAARPDG